MMPDSGARPDQRLDGAEESVPLAPEQHHAERRACQLAWCQFLIWLAIPAVIAVDFLLLAGGASDVVSNSTRRLALEYTDNSNNASRLRPGRGLGEQDTTRQPFRQR